MDPRYPIGKFSRQVPRDDAQREQLIAAIEAAPAKLREAVRGLNDAQLDTPYREGGWTVRQVAHHLPDSHLNSYVRFKLGLTEYEPLIKPYDENLWAKLPDSSKTPVETSVQLLEALHQRWAILLRSMQAGDFGRKVRHPERGLMSLDEMLALYAWHGRHHVAHITSLRDRMGWTAASH